ncbi:alpha,alpha-phosphotrehalase [Vibrio sp. Of7-15]|uniref:alpha,alpha-phosphotrehalase n=1 Tax=Vibrio sp. Of7-15 TaxID=2724879 RepID=UPI001EF204BF|nr:alpha,alpha-phosphotrehalase [Vibrio sp. Of7-15]MCG7497665.1 alpha,alpha-phosphotrehalase [Vibrio sp. Of7-15]
MMTESKARQWWHSASIYQIYPKSFCASQGQATGDIQGIISKLDYLKKLGIEAIWLTPIYSSPQVDNGYDIADYYNISPDYGTMEDFDSLLQQAHERGIKIIMDIVVNHTSTDHQWFQSALEGPDSEYRDYYIWKDGEPETPPNNWQSKFGGSAWQYDEKSKQYYLHLFAKEQADLNWENPKVRHEVKKVISFWAEKGVDGFRLDVINLISKDQAFPSDDIGDGRRFYTDGPRVHEYLQEISEAVFQKYGVVTVGEMSSTSIEHCQQYSDQSAKELSMVFNFHHLKVDYKNGDKWTAMPFDFLALKKLFSDWQAGLHNKGWNALFWCNHDQPRIVSRFGCDDLYRVESAKMLAAAVHFMQGTPYIYQGEEFGMTNPGYQSIEQYQDIESHNMYSLLLQQGLTEAEVLSVLGQKSRDNSRTPVQWNNEVNAGFTTGVPWLEVAENYQEVNAELALKDPDSVFYFYQKLIALRKQLAIITEGAYRDILPQHESIHAYTREWGKQRLLVLCNFYGQTATCDLTKELASFNYEHAECLVNNCSENVLLDKSMTLQPYQALAFFVAG